METLYPQDKKTDTNEAAPFGGMTLFDLRATDLRATDLRAAAFLGKDVDAILRTAVHGKRVVALAGTHQRFVGRLEVDETASRNEEGWLPTFVVMCPKSLGPDEMDEPALDNAINTALADGTTQRVSTKTRMQLDDNYNTFIVLDLPQLSGKHHGLAGWTCYTQKEVRWQMHREAPVTLHLMRVRDVIEDIRTRAVVLGRRLHGDDLAQRAEAMPLARDLAWRFVCTIGEGIKSNCGWYGQLEATHNTYKYRRHGELFGSDDEEVYLSYVSRHNPEADEIIWAPAASECWTPELGNSPLEALTIYAAEAIVAEMAGGDVLDDFAEHLDSISLLYLARSEDKPFDAVFPLDPEDYAARSQELREALAKAASEQEYEKAKEAAKRFASVMSSNLIRLFDLASVGGQLGAGYHPWLVGGRPGQDEGAVRRLYRTTVYEYDVWVPEIAWGESASISTGLEKDYLREELHVRGAMDILFLLSDPRLLQMLRADLTPRRSSAPSCQ